jgi:hypothetical protein
VVVARWIEEEMTLSPIRAQRASFQVERRAEDGSYVVSPDVMAWLKF